MAKYRIYADYYFTVDCGVVEAESKEEAIEKAHETIVNSQHSLCFQCEEEMLDTPQLVNDGVTADLEVER